MVDNACNALASSATARPTFNVEEEDVVIRNGWTPKEEEEEEFTVHSHFVNYAFTLQIMVDCDCLQIRYGLGLRIGLGYS